MQYIWIYLFLAIKNTTDYYYLNGNYQIQLTDKDLEIGGTIFEYDTRKNLDHPFEKLTAKGPTTEELIIALLFQRGNRVPFLNSFITNTVNSFLIKLW